MAETFNESSLSSIHRPRILLVDDHPSNLLVLRSVLDKYSDFLVDAASGSEAIKLVQSLDFCVVLLDVSMPGIDGFETAKAIRNERRTHNLPIIFITAGDIDRSRLDQGFKLGAVDFLVKPLHPLAVQAKVRTFVDLYLERQQSKLEAEQLRRLINSTSEYAIFMLDTEGGIASWNTGAERLKGYKANEIVGQHFSIFYPQEAIARGWPDYELRTASAEGKFEDEGWRIRKDGAKFWANVVINALKDPAGNLLGFSKITRDLTARKEAEENSLKLMEEVTASHRKDEFLATLAHELRNPLAPMRSALQLMRLSKDKEVHINAQSVMDRQLNQMVRLVDDLMDLSRITLGKIDLRLERVPISSIIDSAIETSRPLIERMGHTLNVELPPRIVLVEADPTRLSQVFSNLLNNAAKYNESGGQIFVKASQHGKHLEMSIRDNGIGIALDQLPRIFDMFTQVDQSLEKSQGGLGIGLTLVKRLVEMHSGTIDVKSEGLGRGAEFVVRIPVAPEPAEERKPSIRESAFPKTSLRILIVDDNKDGAESLAMLLKVSGNETRTAYDGEEGMQLAENYRPDLILLDIGLPKVNGYDVCKLIRQKPWGSEPVLIAVTGWGQEEDLRRSRDAGFDHHLVKPLDPRALMQLLGKLKV